MSRTITVISTQSNAEVSVTNNDITTRGELIKELESKTSWNLSDCTMMVGGSRQVLGSDSTALPTMDCIIMVTPSKIKSGK